MNADIWKIKVFCICEEKDEESPEECLGEVEPICMECKCPYLFTEFIYE